MTRRTQKSSYPAAISCWLRHHHIPARYDVCYYGESICYHILILFIITIIMIAMNMTIIMIAMIIMSRCWIDAFGEVRGQIRGGLSWG